MKVIKGLFIVAVTGFAILLFLVIRPVPVASEEECLVQTGVVTEISQGAENDVIFKLKNSDRSFYINRGLENGLILAELHKKLMNKEVVIKYPDYWTPLDPNHTIKHIAKLQLGDEVIFSEVD